VSTPAPARGVGRIVAVAAAVIAVGALAFGVGRFTAFDATTAPALPSTDSAEAGFARDMQVHHGQAVEMAMEIYRKTADDELRTLSYDIATAQSAQRGEMYGWLVSWGLPQSGGPLMAWMQDSSAHQHDPQASEAELREQMGMATDDQLAQLRAAQGGAADCLFLDLMIRHHEGAIPMARAVDELGSEPRVRAVAESMIATQSAEIDAMRSVQTRLACG
jgi:uncharacterized protein (DUF305 family)